MLNQRFQNFDTVKTPESGVKIPFKNTLNINRAERLLAKEKRDQNMNAIMQDAWKCKCMVTPISYSASSAKEGELKIIDHLQKRNCQLCGAFIIGAGSEDEEPLTITITDRTSRSRGATRILLSSGKKLSNENAYGSLQGSNTQSKSAHTKIKTLKQKEDHYFADMSPSEIYSYLRLEESSQRFKQIQGKFCILSSNMLKARKQMVETIFEIGEKLKQKILTTHLAVVFMDILIQDDKIFDKVKQEVLSCTCILLASKFDELDDNIPLIRDLQKAFAKQRVIGYDEIVKAEQNLLFKLNWDLFKLTPMHFLQNLIGQGIAFSNDKVQQIKNQPTSQNTTPSSQSCINTAALMEIDEKTLKSVKKHAEFFADLAIQEYDLQKNFRPSVVAISCIVLARKMSRIVPEWNSVGLEELTDYTYDGEVKRCADKLYKVYQKQFGIVIPSNASSSNNINSACQTSHNSHKTPIKAPVNSQPGQNTGNKSDHKSNNKHNKENQQEKVRSASNSTKGVFVSTVSNGKASGQQSLQNTSYVANGPASNGINLIQLMQKPQIIQEENELPSQFSHNTTRSNDSSEQTKSIPQLSIQELLEPYQIFDHSMEHQPSLPTHLQKPESKELPKKQTDETKLTLTNSYSSDPQSPQNLTYQSSGHQNTASDNSKITSQSKSCNTNSTTAVGSKNQSLVRKSEHSVNPIQRKNYAAFQTQNANASSSNIQSTLRSQTNLGHSNTQIRNLSKNRSQPGFATLINGKTNQIKLAEGSQVNAPSTGSSTAKHCPMSTKNQTKDSSQCLQQCLSAATTSALNVQTQKKAQAATLLQCRNNINNISSSSTTTANSANHHISSSRNNSSSINMLQLNCLESAAVNMDSMCSQTFDMGSSVKQPNEIFQSQKSQIPKKNSANQLMALNTIAVPRHSSRDNLQHQKQSQPQVLSEQSSRECLSKERIDNSVYSGSTNQKILSYDISKETFSNCDADAKSIPNLIEKNSQAQSHLKDVPSQSQQQHSHRHQLSMVPSSQNITQTHINNTNIAMRAAKRSMDITTKNQQSSKKFEQRAQTTKNSLNYVAKSSIKVYQQDAKQKRDQNIAQSINSQENSVTRICMFDISQSQGSTIQHQKTFKQQTQQISYEKYQTTTDAPSITTTLNTGNSSQSNLDFKQASRAARKLLDRKKSSALRNTTLEQICENRQENFMISPSQHAAHNVQTAKSSTSQMNVLQSFSLAAQNPNLRAEGTIQGINSNYIQKNITYVNKLNKINKEKKTIDYGLHNTHTNSKSTSNILTNSQSKAVQQEKQKSTSKLYSALTNPYNSTADLENLAAIQLNEHDNISRSISNNDIHLMSSLSKGPSQIAAQCQVAASSQASQNISAIIGFNSRRASEFKQCDYLKPTLSSISRARSVAPGLKRSTKESKKISQVQNISNTIMDESASFDLTCKNARSPTRVGPIPVYERNRSNQKRQQNSGVRKPQFRGAEDHSSERLRLGVFIGNSNNQVNNDQSLSNLAGNGLSRQSIGKRQSLTAQQTLQSKIGNKSQRNSVSLSFQLYNQSSSQINEDIQTTSVNNSRSKIVPVTQTQRTQILQSKKPKIIGMNSSNPQNFKSQTGMLRKLSSNQNFSSATSYSDTQQSSAANLLSARSIGGAAIPEEEELEEGGILQSHPSVGGDNSSADQDEIYEDIQKTHEYNFEDDVDSCDDGDENDAAEATAFPMNDQNYGSKTIKHIISSLSSTEPVDFTTVCKDSSFNKVQQRFVDEDSPLIRHDNTKKASEVQSVSSSTYQIKPTLVSPQVAQNQ